MARLADRLRRAERRLDGDASLLARAAENRGIPTLADYYGGITEETVGDRAKRLEWFGGPPLSHFYPHLAITAEAQP